MKLREILMGLAVCALAVSCTKGPKADTPEGALHKYVSTAFSVNSVGDKSKLLDLSTGEALAYLEAMNDDAFKKQFIESKLQFVSLKAKDKRQEVTGDVSLVYELNYKESTGHTVHTNKKIAYLTHDPESDTWKIKATKNLKSFVERKEDLVVTPETTPGEKTGSEEK